MNPLIQELQRYGKLSPELVSEITAKTRCITREKGHYFLREGQITSNVFVIEKGLVRAFYSRGDQEINVWFGFENVLVGSVMPLFFDKPSIENIQFLEQSIVWYISGLDLNELYRKSHEMNVIGRRWAEDYCRILEERTFSLQTKTGQQRYHELLADYPDAVRRISLGDIASYLGMKQETLSRIRRRW